MPIYLRYGKIKGEVKEPGPYRGWIELQSFQWGVGRRLSKPTDSSTSRESSGRNVSDVTVQKLFDSISPLLQQEALTGEGVVAIIDFVKDGHAYLRYTLTDTVISAYQLGQGDKPPESLTLSFQKFVVKQTPGGPPPPP